jgi:hypothetical protein
MPLGFATAAAFALATAGTSIAAEQNQPTAVVELFQSQGCSSCPPANANVIALSDRTDLLTLSFGVTYWDDLGWKDTFASPKYTDRQWDYAHAFSRKQVFTPEVVVNGRADVVGADRAELESLIKREAHVAGSGPAVEIKGDSVTVGSGNGAEKADVWLVRYNPNIEEVPIKRGENGGRTLPHKNVVKELVKLGDWSGHLESYPIPVVKQDGLREAVLVQAGPGGAILASARDR